MLTLTTALCSHSLCKSSLTGAISGGSWPFCSQSHRQMPFLGFPKKGSTLLLDVKAGLATCFGWKRGLHPRAYRLGSLAGSLPSGTPWAVCSRVRSLSALEPNALSAHAGAAALPFLFPMTSPAATPPLPFRLSCLFLSIFIRMSACWRDFRDPRREWDETGPPKSHAILHF